MIKKYQEFLEAYTRTIGGNHPPFQLYLNYFDFDSDYDFHKNINPLIEETKKCKDLYTRYLFHKDNREVYEDKHTLLKKEFVDYIKKTLTENNIHESVRVYVNQHLEDQKEFGVTFEGNFDDLVKINKIYGITDNKNIEKND